MKVIAPCGIDGAFFRRHATATTRKFERSNSPPAQHATTAPASPPPQAFLVHRSGGLFRTCTDRTTERQARKPGKGTAPRRRPDATGPTSDAFSPLPVSLNRLTCPAITAQALNSKTTQEDR